MSKPLFSVVLIARNESKTLPHLMSSLKEFQNRGGEILLLDTGSKDNTAEIARSLGCIVHEVGDKFRITIDAELADKINNHFIVDNEQPLVKAGESLFDYASARNYIAQFSSNNLIATPDCDEIYTKFDIDKINETITNGAEQLEYEFVFSHDEYNNPVIKFRHCKFYDKTKLSWRGIIHEVLVGEAKKVYLDESIIKLEHYQNIETNRSGYLKGLALDCFEHPESDRNSHYLAREMMYLGRFKSAIKEFKRHLTLGGWPTEASQSMLYLGDCYKYLGDDDEMVKWYFKSFDKEPRREPLMRLAEHYFYKQKHLQTIAYAEASLSITQLPFYSNHQPYYEDTPHALLYVSYWWTGNKTKSEEHWKKAIGFSPKNKKYIDDGKFYKPKISFVIPTLGREDGLKRCIESIEKLNYPEANIEGIIKEDSFENRIGVPKLLKQGIAESTGEWIIYASNDCEFTPESINEALAVGQGGFVAFNTGEVYPDEGNICEHFMIRRDIIDKIGEVFDTDFYHVGVDNLLWAKMKKLGIAVRADKAIVKHKHFTKTGEPMDEVYKIAWDSEKVSHDRELLKKKLEQLV